MLDLINANLNKVKSIVKDINALNRVSAVRNMDKRVELMILAMSFIQKSQNDFLDYKLEAKTYDIPELINLDFEISQYANRSVSLYTSPSPRDTERCRMPSSA
jgi:hypothetical protein